MGFPRQEYWSGLPFPSSWLLYIYRFKNPCLLLFSHSVMSDSVIPWTARLPCPSLSPGICSDSCPLNWWCHPTISFSVIPFSSCLQSFPASGYFPMSWLFSSSGQSIGASDSASILWCSVFFMVQLLHLYMTTGKIINLTIWTFIGKVMSLLFNMLSRFLIAFLPRSKHLFISWLQSPKNALVI